MDWLRHTLIVCIIGVLVALFYQWNNFEAPIVEHQTNREASSAPTTPELAVTSVSDVPTAPGLIPVESTAVSTSLISVNTPEFNIKINPAGGDIEDLSLKKYTVSETDSTPLQILVDNAQNIFIAQSGLIGKNGTDDKGPRPIYSSSQTSYSMDDNNDLVVDLHTTQHDGVKIIKRFTFKRDSYEIAVDYVVHNTSAQIWSAHMYGQMKRDDHPPYNSVTGMMNSFLGMATTNAEDNYYKRDFDDLNDTAYRENINHGFIAMVQHYFVSAWVPRTNGTNSYYANRTRNGLYLLGYTSSEIDVAPGETSTISATFYSGPKDQKSLAELSNYLDLTVDYSWLWWLSKPLFSILDFFHSILGNWGFAIIAVTILIKAVFYYPSAVSYRSMAAMRKFTPLMQEIRERYSDDRQKQQMEMMKLYKQEKINPMAGCLPILIQMPVFLAFYWMLMESVELRQAPFIFWITDLSVKDPYFILPVLMALVMFFQQRLNPAPADPMQAKIMQFMPLMFGLFFMMFPAGLVLYWLINSLISMLQQIYIYKTLEK